MCRAAPEAVRELERFGVPFSRTAGGSRADPAARNGLAAARAAVAGRAHRPSPAADALPAVLARRGRVLRRVLRAGPALRGPGARSDAAGAPVTGVMAYELATGELHAFSAASVILATGGCGRVFATTSNGHSATGDAMALALRSGLPLQDMEFYQFHPTGLHRLGILVPEAARGEGGVLRNAAGERVHGALRTGGAGSGAGRRRLHGRSSPRFARDGGCGAPAATTCCWT